MSAMWIYLCENLRFLEYGTPRFFTIAAELETHPTTPGFVRLLSTVDRSFGQPMDTFDLTGLSSDQSTSSGTSTYGLSVWFINILSCSPRDMDTSVANLFTCVKPSEYLRNPTCPQALQHHHLFFLFVFILGGPEGSP